MGHDSSVANQISRIALLNDPALATLAVIHTTIALTEVSFLISTAAHLLLADFLIACVPTLPLLSKNHPFPDFFYLGVDASVQRLTT